MVSVLDSKLSGLGLNPGRSTVLCSWARHFTLIVHLITHVYKKLSVKNVRVFTNRPFSVSLVVIKDRT